MNRKLCYLFDSHLLCVTIAPECLGLVIASLCELRGLTDGSAHSAGGSYSLYGQLIKFERLFDAGEDGSFGDC